MNEVDYRLIERLIETVEGVEAKLDLLLEQKKPKQRKATADYYTPMFEEIWKHYPKRTGGNPKKKAFSAYKARWVEFSQHGGKFDFFFDCIKAGIERYSDYCDAMVEDKRFVMQAATFFGPDKHYENDWTIPTQAEALPKSNDELTGWAQEKRLREARPGESMAQYRQALTELYRNV